MELSKEQTKELNGYLWSCGIHFYDVRDEILDHFASILETRLESNPDLDFKQEIIKIHKEFSPNGFKDFLIQKKKSVKKKFYTLTIKHLKTFFKLPKVIISIALFYLLVTCMNQYDTTSAFFTDINVVFLLVVIQLFVRMKLNNNEEKLLVLKRSENMFSLIYSYYYLILQPLQIFRTDASYHNQTYNYLQIGLIVILLISYWCTEYVYYQNKKELEKQYPNVFI